MHSYSRNWSSDQEYLNNIADGNDNTTPTSILDNSMEVLQSQCTQNSYKMDMYNTNNNMVVCSVNDEVKYWSDTGSMHSPECCNNSGHSGANDSIIIINDDHNNIGPTQSSPQQIVEHKSRIPCSSQSNLYCTPYQIFTNSIGSNYHLDELHYHHNGNLNHLKSTENNNNCNALNSTSLYNNNGTVLTSIETIDNNKQSTSINSTNANNNPTQPPFVRVVKKRNTANKKERRRTQSINNAYADLRDCIPSVPADTKLSKIKTLRLATSYISYLKGVLDGEKTSTTGFFAEIENLGGGSGGGHRHNTTNNKHSIVIQKEITGDITLVRGTQSVVNSSQQRDLLPLNNSKSLDIIDKDDNISNKAKGRTGWPEHVWALEFKQEQNL